MTQRCSPPSSAFKIKNRWQDVSRVSEIGTRQLTIIASPHSARQEQRLVQISDKVYQKSKRNILLGDTTNHESYDPRRPADLRLVRIHQDLGGIADGGNHVDFIIGPPVLAKHAVFAGDIVDGCKPKVISK